MLYLPALSAVSPLGAAYSPPRMLESQSPFFYFNIENIENHLPVDFKGNPEFRAFMQELSHKLEQKSQTAQQEQTLEQTRRDSKRNERHIQEQEAQTDLPDFPDLRAHQNQLMWMAGYL